MIEGIFSIGERQFQQEVRRRGESFLGSKRPMPGNFPKRRQLYTGASFQGIALPWRRAGRLRGRVAGTAQQCDFASHRAARDIQRCHLFR